MQLFIIHLIYLRRIKMDVEAYRSDLKRRAFNWYGLLITGIRL